MQENNQAVALITGSSRGIGKAIALKLADDGFQIALNGRDEASLKEVQKQIESKGGRAEFFPMDLATVTKAPQSLIEDVIKRFGRLDVLVNNAGLALAGTFKDISLADFDRIMDLNVKVPLFLTQAAIPYLKQNASPTVINISSVVGTKPYKNQSLYSASKHALNGLMKAAAKELQSEGIRVHIVSPGGVGTEMIHYTRPDLDIKSLIQPEEVAQVVSFLVGFKNQGVIDEVRIRRADNEAFA